MLRKIVSVEPWARARLVSQRREKKAALARSFLTGHGMRMNRAYRMMPEIQGLIDQFFD